jgi:hypothetical protein
MVRVCGGRHFWWNSAASQRLLCAWRAELTSASGVGEGILGRGIAGVSVGFVSLWIVVVGRRRQ